MRIFIGEDEIVLPPEALDDADALFSAIEANLDTLRAWRGVRLVPDHITKEGKNIWNA